MLKGFVSLYFHRSAMREEERYDQDVDPRIYGLGDNRGMEEWAAVTEER